MYFTISSLTFSCLSFVFTYYSFNYIREKNITTKLLKKWNSLTGLVSVKHKKKYKIILISIQLLCKAIYVSFLQYMNNSVKKLDKNNYELTYVVEGNIYKYRFRIRRGPKPIIMASNESNDDISNEIISLLGPQWDWHGQVITPDTLDHNIIFLNLANGEENKYKFHEPIPSF